MDQRASELYILMFGTSTTRFYILTYNANFIPFLLNGCCEYSSIQERFHRISEKAINCKHPYIFPASFRNSLKAFHLSYIKDPSGRKHVSNIGETMQVNRRNRASARDREQ